MIHLGIDPDLHDTAVATLDGDRIEIHMVRVPATLKGREAMIEMAKHLESYCHTVLHLPHWTQVRAAVEGQKFLIRGNARYEDIGRLSFISGAAVAGLARLTFKTFVPEPHEWKGTVPKHIHQARIARDLGWAVELKGGQDPYQVPLEKEIRELVPKPSDWKHAMDAVGLALWARRQPA